MVIYLLFLLAFAHLHYLASNALHAGVAVCLRFGGQPHKIL